MDCRAIIEAVAARILAALEGEATVDPVLARTIASDILAIVRGTPRPRTKNRTTCEENILRVIAGSSRAHLTTPQVLSLLEANGYLHGESTVKYALARLVKAGLLLSSRRLPRGYRLPG